MPVRARSRTSRSSRKASQFAPMSRSSSSAASNPVAITPPSRSSAAGSSAIASASSSAISRRRVHGLAQHVEQGGGAVRQALQQRRHRSEGRAQAGEFARTHLAQRDARGDALDVADAAQRLAQAGEVGVLERLHRVVTLARDTALALRPRQPLAQRAAAHAGAAGVDQREQRRRVLAAQGLGQLEVAVRRRRQLEQVARALHRQAAHVRERSALRVLGETEQGGGGRLRRIEVLGVVAGEAGDAKLLAQLAQAERGIELPGRPMRQRGRRLLQRRHDLVAVDQHLGSAAGATARSRVPPRCTPSARARLA